MRQFRFACLAIVCMAALAVSLAANPFSGLFGLKARPKSGPEPRPSDFPGPATLASTRPVGRQLLVGDPTPANLTPVRYAFVMPEDDQRRVLREAPKLQKGDLASDVIERLGLPSNDVVMGGKGASGRRSRCVIYYFARRDFGLVNNFDPSIELFFDDQGRLRNLASNLPEIPSINWPQKVEPTPTN